MKRLPLVLSLRLKVSVHSCCKNEVDIIFMYHHIYKTRKVCPLSPFFSETAPPILMKLGLHFISDGSGLPEPENPTGFGRFSCTRLNPNPKKYEITKPGETRTRTLNPRVPESHDF